MTPVSPATSRTPLAESPQPLDEGDLGTGPTAWAASPEQAEEAAPRLGGHANDEDRRFQSASGTLHMNGDGPPSFRPGKQHMNDNDVNFNETQYDPSSGLPNMQRYASSIMRQRMHERSGPVRSASLPAMVHRRSNFNPRRQGTGDSGGAPLRKATGLINKTLIEPQKPLAAPPSFKSSLNHIVRYSWLNVLLVFIPVSWICHFLHLAPAIVFTFSALAIVPLAALLSFATEEIALRTSDTVGGLLNATLGNTVELLVSILALVKGELRVVQSSMLGSILSNCLLVLGMCFFASGLRFHEAGYSTRPAQLQINLLGISTTAIVIPVAFHVAMDARDAEPLDVTNRDILRISHGVAIILLFVYFGYLTFQLWTHAYLYMPQHEDEDGTNSPPSPRPLNVDGPQPPQESVFRLPSWGSSSTSSISTIESNEPKMSLRMSFALLVIVTVFAGFTAEWLVSAIEPLTAQGGISREFIALILLPIVSNSAEHWTAVTVSTKGKLDLSMSVAVDSSIQIALFVIPLLIIIGWGIGQPLSLYFDPFETLVLFLATVSVNWAIADQYSNWLEGATLMTLYLIVAVVFWYYPGIDN